MKNEEVFKLKEVLVGMGKSAIRDIPFAMQLVDLEIEVDKEVKKIRSLFAKVAPETEKDQPLRIAQAEIRRLKANLTIPVLDREASIAKINGQFSKEEIAEFNAREARIQEVLLQKATLKNPKLDREKLPVGLLLSEYKVLFLICK